MFSMPLAIFEELTSVADETGLTVDQIIQEALLDWIHSVAPTRMRNAQITNDFPASKHPFKLIEGGQRQQMADDSIAWDCFGGHLRTSNVVRVNLPINSQKSLK